MRGTAILVYPDFTCLVASTLEMGSPIVKQILSRVEPEYLTDRIRKILPDIFELRRGRLTYRQIVPELKRHYKVEIGPEGGDDRQAARKLARIVWKIQKTKKSIPTETILAPATTPAPERDVLAEMKRKIEAGRRHGGDHAAAP